MLANNKSYLQNCSYNLVLDQVIRVCIEKYAVTLTCLQTISKFYSFFLSITLYLSPI